MICVCHVKLCFWIGWGDGESGGVEALLGAEVGAGDIMDVGEGEGVDVFVGGEVQGVISGEAMMLPAK
jgi:hypothetical protein